MVKLTFRKFYQTSPDYLKKAIDLNYKKFIFPYSCGGIAYLKWKKFLNKTEFWNLDQLEKYQIKRLRYLLNYSYKNVPYYHKLFKKINFDVQKVNRLSDLEKIPLLHKDTIKNNMPDFIAKCTKPSNFYKRHTSGSTGKPLVFFKNRNLILIHDAILHNILKAGGVNPSDRKLYILAEKFLKDHSNNDKLLIKDVKSPIKRLYLSSFSLDEKNLRYCLKEIIKFNPVYAQGNPSTLAKIANSAKELKNDIQIKYFLSTSEKLFPSQRKVIQDNLNCETYDFYSLGEQVTSACECSEHNGLHTYMIEGVTEITNEEGEQRSPGEEGHIIGTGLHNFTMPLIRYVTGDEGEISKDECLCGRKSSILKNISGRSTERLYYNGRVINSATLSLAFLDMEDIIESQVIQRNFKELIVKIVRKKNIMQNSTKKLIKNLRTLVGEDINIKIRDDKKISLTKNGKYQFIKQYVKKQT